MRILIIEDEKKMAAFIERGLKQEHYAVDVAHDGEQGLCLAQMNPYDLIILDVMLPNKDGISICKEIRSEKGAVPILLLTAKNTVKDKVTGLNAGADDYLTKPFDIEELTARVKALLRRSRSEKTTLLKTGDLELNQATRQVSRAGKEISLTSREFGLLRYLMLHANQVVTRTMLSQHVWNQDFDSCTNVIDVYINYLRSKIEKGFDKPLIHAVRSLGYLLKAEDECES